MIQKLLKIFFGSKHERDLKLIVPLLHKINSLEPWALGLDSQEFPLLTQAFKKRLNEGESLNQILPEAFALAREAARRTLGERPYDVQILGGIILHQGKITEMKTGEGKTLSSVTAAYLNSLTGKGLHMVTVNDYLAERDALWMKPVYDYLGVTVGYVVSSMDPENRIQAYQCDITYATNNELGFDYLRDNMRWDISKKVQRGHAYCIIDEIDSILIDEARTPLIISGAVDDDTSKYQQVDQMIGFLKECDKDPKTGTYPEEPVGDFKLEEKNKKVMFTDQGMNRVEELLQKRKLINGSLFSEENFEYIHYMTQAMKAHLMFHKDVDYVVQDGKVEIVDEFTGRILHGRRYSEGLHQAIEAKEHIRVAQQNKTIATITFQNYFRLYGKISGMTGTADTEAKEFIKIYNLDVVVVPTNRPLARQDNEDIIFFNEEFKFTAIAQEILEAHKRGQPVLVGTVSIEKSEKLSSFLTKKGIRHEILNAKNHHREAMIIAEAGAAGSVTIATNMAGRGTDIKLGGNPEFRTRKKVGTDATPEVYQQAYEKEFDLWRQEYEKVKGLGGLYVIGTERHESRRIDNQLRGRSGRQGDPGRSRFFVSLDDTLMRLFANDGLRNMMGKMGMADGEPLEHKWLSKSLEGAQKKVEDRNFEIRKHLLDYDDVLNKQRIFVYEQRDKILSDPDLKTRILTTAREMLEDLLDPLTKKGTMKEDITEVLALLHEDFFFEPTLPVDELKTMKPLELLENAMDALTKDMQQKEDLVGKDNLNLFTRQEYLRKVDSLWQEHLENLEALREAVYLRAYAQKNPLLEYKNEGFQIFDLMIDEIRTFVAKKLLKVRIQKAPATSERQGVRNLNTSHTSMGSFGALTSANPVRASSGERKEAQGEKIQVVRTMPKVGRNDPCPCGSGKKYKLCHGK